MIGDLNGYNMLFRASVSIRIDRDGRVDANVQSTPWNGYVNDQRVYSRDAEFDIECVADGYKTVQRGDRNNRIH